MLDYLPEIARSENPHLGPMSNENIAFHECLRLPVKIRCSSGPVNFISERGYGGIQKNPAIAWWRPFNPNCCKGWIFVHIVFWPRALGMLRLARACREKFSGPQGENLGELTSFLEFGIVFKTFLTVIMYFFHHYKSIIIP